MARIEPKCPMCGTTLEAEYVDVGVGEERCSPYSCPKYIAALSVTPEPPSEKENEGG